jgi:PhoPQ-activated pathogenicity-related protein
MLVKALRKYDSQPTLTVSDIPNGSIFFTPNGKKYLKEKKIKTRFQCKSLNNNKIYLFNPLAEVRI